MRTAPSSVRADPGTVPDQRPRRRRGGRRGAVAVAAVVLVAAGGGAVAVNPFGRHPKPPSIDNAAPTALAPVAQGRLTARTPVNGTLGYAGGYDAVNQAKGIITGLPKLGQVIRHGHVLYKVSGKAVLLLKGWGVPAYRTLSKGMKGDDVRELNAELVTLGYAPGGDLSSDSNYFSTATAAALKRLQKDMGLDKTGTLDLGEAVFLPLEEVRISKINATVGGDAPPGSAVLQASSTDRRVTVALNVSQQSQVKVGDAVTITLPDGRTTNGTVSSMGTVAKEASGGGSSTIDVSIKLSDPGVAGRLDQAPVQVSITTQSVDNALAVPVNALLALAGGGYAVEVAGPGNARHLVTVTLGLFDDSAGTVQVTGTGLTAGQQVVVPAS